MLETLQAKRAALVSLQEQLVGQINRVGGAISVIDELIAEIPAPEAALPLGSMRDAIRRAVDEVHRSAPEMLPIPDDGGAS